MNDGFVSHWRVEAVCGDVAGLSIRSRFPLGHLVYRAGRAAHGAAAGRQSGSWPGMAVVPHQWEVETVDSQYSV